MNKSKLQKINTQQGITLFVTLILMGVLLGVSASLLNITLKQYQLAGVSYASEVAFQASLAGMECAVYRDWIDTDPSNAGKQAIFDIGADLATLSCFDATLHSSSLTNEDGSEDEDGEIDSGDAQNFQFSWGDPEICTEFSVYKFFPGDPVKIGNEGFRDPSAPDGPTNVCPAGSIGCTVIQSRGYNVGCNLIDGGSRVIEREYTQVY